MDKYGYCFVGVNINSDINISRTAQSLRAQEPEAKITAFTDQPLSGDIFQNIIHIPSKDPHKTLRKFPQYPDQGIFAKARCIPKAPYEYCIYSDYDIRFYGEIHDIFHLLEDGNFDFCAAVDAGEVSIRGFYPYVPDCFPKFHLGILAWHNNERMKDLFSLWRQLIIEMGERGIAGGAIDELTFSYAAYETNVRYSILPANYCLRFIFPYIVRGEVKALHGRSEEYDNLIKAINSDLSLRVGHESTILAKHEPGVGFTRL